ncbi:hypothetical protein ACLMJK_001889 [Lecanora helva]
MENNHESRVSLQAAIKIQALNPHSYAVNVPADHCYGEAAHGGFVASAILSAIREHFKSTLEKQRQPHTFDIQLNFLRPVTVGKCQVDIKDIKIGLKRSTIQFALRRNSIDHVVGYASNIDMEAEQGLSYPTSFKLQYPPPKAKFENLLNDCDPHWASLRIPWSPNSYLKAGTQLCWFTPAKGSDNPSVIDIWFTPLSPDETFTTEMVGSIADHWGCLLDNLHPHSVWSTEYMAAATKERDMTMGTDLSKAPVGFYTSSISMEIKKQLPPEGVRWLFTRAQAKKIYNGRLDMEVLVLDEGDDLIAVSHQTVFFPTGHRFAKKAERL